MTEKSYKELKPREYRNIVDDIIIYSNTWNEHIVTIDVTR